jgi:uncharacterized protein YcbX
LSEINIYPIKSLSGVKLESASITKYGIAHPENPQVIDRKWMVINEKFDFLSQRNYPKMALIKTAIETDYLILSAPGKTELKVPIQSTNDRIECRVWNLKINGYRYGGDVSKWLSDFLQVENLDLVNFGNDLEPRKTNLVDKKLAHREKDEIIYSDDSPFMLISESSLDDLNSRLKDKVTMRNFRPNFVVKNVSAPYDEDNWTNLKIGNDESTFIKTKHCTRCLLTTVMPDTGVKNSEQEPLKTLKEFRLNKEIYGVSPMFGIDIACENIGGGIIRIGDQIKSFTNEV